MRFAEESRSEVLQQLGNPPCSPARFGRPLRAGGFLEAAECRHMCAYLGPGGRGGGGWELGLKLSGGRVKAS